jgi:flagellar basal body P-ring formation protein FlgA
MRRQTIFALAMTFPLAHVAAASDWREAAEDSLRAELQERHPAVAEWKLADLATEKQVASLREAEQVSVDTRQVGARSAVRIEWTNRTRNREATTLWFAVEGLQAVAVSKIDLRSGSIVDEATLEQRSVDVLALNCEPASEPARMNAMRVLRTVKAGGAICASWLAPRPPVMRGELVTVRSVAGPVTVLAKGIAQQDGSMGQVLKIRNPSSRESFAAAVTGNGEVTVQ